MAGDSAAGGPAPMTAERWTRVSEILAAALEQSPERRRGFLAETCGDDADLRREIESLIAALPEGHDVLEQPAASLFGLPGGGDMHSWVGTRAGPYLLTREIGEGGMGTVYEAVRDDDQFRKRVAIKMIRPGRETKLVLRRFRYERDILAGLDHPNIAALYDGGITDGQHPWFAMEFVEGRPIDEYCAALRLTVRERLSLFRSVCNAVQFAHRNLVVHRDLKPSNIMVTAGGVVKLLDFGIAKVLSEDGGPEGLTQAGLHAMTADYASPDQVRGVPITTASDVYSLGVVLYELLAGVRPYRAEHLPPAEMVTVICETDPPPPSIAARGAAAAEFGESARKHQAILAGELDTIVLTAMRKEPSLRYSSVEQFGEDVRRYLEGLPVTAQRATPWYRVRKFIRRHRAAAAALAVVVPALIGGIVATTWQARRAEVERSKAEEVNAFLRDMLASADPSIRGREVTVAQVLDDAAHRVERLSSRPQLEAELRSTIGSTYLALGLFDEAQPHLLRALEIQRRIHGPRHLQVARAMRDLGSLYEKRGDAAKAGQLYRSALSITREDAGEENARTAGLLDDLARIHQGNGDLQAAESLQTEALNIRRRVLGERHADVAASLNNLAVVYGQRGNYAVAESLHREALRVIREVRGTDDAEVAQGLSTVAGILSFQHKFAAADSFFVPALEMRRRLLGPEHPDYAWTLLSYATSLYDRGDYAGAAARTREVVALRGSTLPEEHPVLAASLLYLGRSLDHLGRFAEAEGALTESLTLRRNALPEGHWLVAAGESVLGEHYLNGGQLAKAEPHLVEGYHGLATALGAGHPRTKEALQSVIALYERWGKNSEAAKFRSLLGD
jgi:serine/threonine protein kinase